MGGCNAHLSWETQLLGGATADPVMTRQRGLTCEALHEGHRWKEVGELSYEGYGWWWDDEVMTRQRGLTCEALHEGHRWKEVGELSYEGYGWWWDDEG
ncbi:hypothetical protein C4D60_Mb04t16840 [Musa balbisiana]|uniref:Uncharacterized protein n=1 Tax=Musa balbisiana TaxID=52838 RepID=A0A4V4H9T7_MUSBA|nr:hypothetical protein C4D60_Mb04t16840 [Musa balbisiana]